MIEKFNRIIQTKSGETEIEFVFNDNLGMNDLQALQIMVLAKKYLDRYPEVKISKICDYFSMDHSEIDDDNYMHDCEGEEYSRRDSLASYFVEDKIIGFNHILCRNFELDDIDLIGKAAMIKNISKGDLLQIKFYEKQNNIRTVFIHEFAHAIEYQYRIYEDSRMKVLYEKYNAINSFKDIHEFIAECFTTKEYFPKNKIANEVCDVISKYCS